MWRSATPKKRFLGRRGMRSGKKVARNCGRHGICVCDRPLDACLSVFVALEGVFSAFRCLFESVCGVSV